MLHVRFSRFVLLSISFSSFFPPLPFRLRFFEVFDGRRGKDDPPSQTKAVPVYDLAASPHQFANDVIQQHVFQHLLVHTALYVSWTYRDGAVVCFLH
jgi:hypothetical protein